jgi:hypothetical protein
VLFTDISSSFASWHRASAGVPESFAARARDRVRVPLFSAMVAFDRPLLLPLDAFALADTEEMEPTGGNSSVSAGGVQHGAALWWAARTQSKPGLQHSSASTSCETWTLISTPRFALAEIQAEPMRDAATGAFKPQEGGYLNGAGGPSSALLAAFMRHATRLVDGNGGRSARRVLEGGDNANGRDFLAEEGAPNGAKVVYLQGQRWGSALPAASSLAGRDMKGRSDSTVDVLGVAYDGRQTVPLVYDRPAAAAGCAGDGDQDFIADDAMRLYYAGDFCSRRNPGLEAAALSGVDVADHIAAAVHAARA